RLRHGKKGIPSVEVCPLQKFPCSLLYCKPRGINNLYKAKATDTTLNIY
ncbi:25739_t:CDS:1, partial [Dentiscutata erythropus]